MELFHQIEKNAARRKRRKRETWKTKFASALKSTITQYNIGEKLSKGFSRILMKKGF